MITAGCKAIIIKSAAGNEGKMVTCLQFLGKVDGFSYPHDYWLVDRTLNSRLGAPCEWVHESWLMRIDDGIIENLEEIQTMMND